MNYLIIGAAKGIGRGLAQRLRIVEPKSKISIMDSLSNWDELRNTFFNLTGNLVDLSYIQSQTEAEDCISPSVHIYAYDLFDGQSVTIGITDAAFFMDGEVDVLINVATHEGVPRTARCQELSFQSRELKENVHANLTLPMDVIATVLDYMWGDHGCIINIGPISPGRLDASPEFHRTIDGGLSGFSKALAKSLAPAGFRVNAVLLGFINVADECKAMDDELEGEASRRLYPYNPRLTKQRYGQSLMERVGKVEDVFAAVKYLVNSDLVTGTEVFVGGLPNGSTTCRT